MIISQPIAVTIYAPPGHDILRAAVLSIGLLKEAPLPDRRTYQVSGVDIHKFDRTQGVVTGWVSGCQKATVTSTPKQAARRAWRRRQKASREIHISLTTELPRPGDSLPDGLHIVYTVGELAPQNKNPYEFRNHGGNFVEVILNEPWFTKRAADDTETMFGTFDELARKVAALTMQPQYMPNDRSNRPPKTSWTNGKRRMASPRAPLDGVARLIAASAE